MTIEQYYLSSWQQPISLVIPQFIFLAYLLTRKDRAKEWLYCVIFTVTSIMDAWLTADTVFGIGKFSGFAATAIPLFFVYWGDFRVFVKLTEGSQKSKTSLGKLLLPAVLGLIVPVTSFGLVKGLAADLLAQQPRFLFLAYEGMFLILLAGIISLKVVKGTLNLRLSSLVFLYYGLWVLADVMIIQKVFPEFAWMIRTLANLLYYAGWAPWVYWHSKMKRKSV